MPSQDRLLFDAEFVSVYGFGLFITGGLTISRCSAVRRRISEPSRDLPKLL